MQVAAARCIGLLTAIFACRGAMLAPAGKLATGQPVTPHYLR